MTRELISFGIAATVAAIGFGAAFRADARIGDTVNQDAQAAIRRLFTTIRLINGSTGDPGLYIDYPGSNDAILFDAGDNAALTMQQLRDLGSVFITHHHIDHFVGFDRIFRANLDCDKVLHVFGPVGTIERVYRRITSYELPKFNFQKLVLRVTDVTAGLMRSADLNLAAGLPEPQVTEQRWRGEAPVLFENDTLKVEAAFADHSAPCLAYALVEKRGVHPDSAKLAKGLLKPGPWVAQVLTRLREGADGQEKVTINGGSFSLAQLQASYFTYSAGARVAYITDTLWSEASKPGLIRLARAAQSLYCDSFYLSKHLKQAQKHKHMTAEQAAELATLAGVGELHLIHFSGRYAGQYHLLLEEAKRGFERASATFAGSGSEPVSSAQP